MKLSMKEFMFTIVLLLGLVMMPEDSMAFKAVKVVNTQINASDSTQVDSLMMEKAQKIAEAVANSEQNVDRIGWFPGFCEDFLLPIFLCVVLPLGIVFICLYFRRKREKERSDLLLAMMDKGIDVSAFVAAEQKAEPANKRGKEYGLMIWGGVLLMLGIASSCSAIIVDGGILFVSLPVLGIGLGLFIVALIVRHWGKKDDEKQID